jgi:hypothetical protein
MEALLHVKPAFTGDLKESTFFTLQIGSHHFTQVSGVDLQLLNRFNTCWKYFLMHSRALVSKYKHFPSKHFFLFVAA